MLQPHRVNQNMIVNAGLLEDLFALLYKPLDASSLASIALIHQVFVLMRLLAVENDEVQKRLFARVDVLLDLPRKINVPEPTTAAARALHELQVARALCVGEIFTSGKVWMFAS